MIDSVVFAGSPRAAVVVLDALVAEGIRVLRVVTQPDVRRGRGSALMPTPVKTRAQELGIEVSYDVEGLACADAQAAVVVAYGRLIPKAILSTNPMINVHFSLLPRWRGAAPVERALMAGDESTGVCIMEMEESLDSGGVYARVETDISIDDTTESLTMRLASMGATALLGVLREWPIAAQPQVGDATYAKKISANDLRIDWNKSASSIARQVRAVSAYTFDHSHRRLRIVEAEALEGDVSTGRVSGEFLGNGNFSTANGVLLVKKVQPEGKSPMSFSDWVRGSRMSIGEILGGE